MAGAGDTGYFAALHWWVLAMILVAFGVSFERILAAPSNRVLVILYWILAPYGIRGAALKRFNVDLPGGSLRGDILPYCLKHTRALRVC